MPCESREKVFRSGNIIYHILENNRVITLTYELLLWDGMGRIVHGDKKEIICNIYQMDRL